MSEVRVGGFPRVMVVVGGCFDVNDLFVVVPECQESVLVLMSVGPLFLVLVVVRGCP